MSLRCLVDHGLMRLLILALERERGPQGGGGGQPMRDVIPAETPPERTDIRFNCAAWPMALAWTGEAELTIAMTVTGLICALLILASDD